MRSALPIAVAAIGLVGTLVLVAIGGRGPGGGGPPGPSPAAGPAGRGYRYIWTGTPKRAFSEGEFRAVAADDPLVVIEKGYGTTFQDWDQAARTLVALNPRAIVLVDFLAGALPPALQSRWGSAFDPSWLLRDSTGNVIQDCSSGRCKYRVDVSDPAYRSFVEHEVLTRLRAAPYAGVMYDNLHYYDARRYPTLTPQRIRQLNQGFRSLVEETRRKIGPNELLFFNGVSRNVGKVTLPDRGFDLLRTADGAQDEVFCYMDNQDRFRPASELVADDSRYLRLGSEHRTILESVQVENPAGRADAVHIGRYCFGHFLMSYVPGYTRIQFKAYPTQGAGPQIAENFTPEQALDLGDPMAGFTQTGTVLERSFRRGWVFVNVGGSWQTITVPADVTLWNGGVRGPSFRKGQTYSIPPTDAAFFLRTGFGTPVATPSG